MKNRKFYIVLALLFVTVLLLFVGVACNTEEPPGGTESPSATASPNAGNTDTGQTTPSATPDAMASSENQVTSGEDNEVTFPEEWGDWVEPTTSAETTAVPVTESGTATQGTVTQTPARSPTAAVDSDNIATLMPDDTESPQKTESPKQTGAAATATPAATPTATPIGVDAEGWVDKWY